MMHQTNGWNSLEDLQGYDVFVLPEANIPFKASEQQALLDYVRNGGQQLAKFENNGEWASNYGYSDLFNVTADTTGHVHKDLTLRINPNYSGSANLRLKVDGDNKITQDVTIDDVDAGRF